MLFEKTPPAEPQAGNTAAVPADRVGARAEVRQNVDELERFFATGGVFGALGAFGFDAAGAAPRDRAASPSGSALYVPYDPGLPQQPPAAAGGELLEPLDDAHDYDELVSCV